MSNIIVTNKYKTLPQKVLENSENILVLQKVIDDLDDKVVKKVDNINFTDIVIG